MFIFTPFFINITVPGFSNEDKDQATLMFRILLPYLFLQINNSFLITVLNAEEKYGRAELLGVTNTVVNILSLMILYPYVGVWALIFSLLIGKVIEFIFYTKEVYNLGFKFMFKISIPEFDHLDFFKTMQRTFLYVGATQIYSIVLTASISFLPEGTFAVFKYVQNLANKVRGLFVQPFMTIFFTKYSILLQKVKPVVHEFNKNIGTVINVNVIIIIGTVLLGDLIIDLLWGGKKFDLDNVKLAYLFLLFNVGSVLISSIGAVYRKMSVAQGDGKKLYLFWGIAQLLSAGVTYVLITNFRITGLFFIIPINGFLLGTTSYLVYRKTVDSIPYYFVSWQNSIMLVLIVIAILVKYSSLNYCINKNVETYIFILSTVLLCAYPIVSIYKLFTKESNIG